MVVYAPAQVISAPAQLITAPAQPPATGAVVYTALFLFHTQDIKNCYCGKIIHRVLKFFTQTIEGMYLEFIP